MVLIIANLTMSLAKSSATKVAAGQTQFASAKIHFSSKISFLRKRSFSVSLKFILKKKGSGARRELVIHEKDT